MAPFGYVKHPEIKNKLMVNGETAWVVRKIFDLSLHEMGASKIVKTLMAEQLPSGNGFLQEQRGGRNPQEKWLRIEGTHEAIISQEVFETV